MWGVQIPCFFALFCFFDFDIICGFVFFPGYFPIFRSEFFFVGKIPHFAPIFLNETKLFAKLLSFPDFLPINCRILES